MNQRMTVQSSYLVGTDEEDCANFCHFVSIRTMIYSASKRDGHLAIPDSLEVVARIRRNL